MTALKSTVFRSGGSQAVRIPKALRLDARRVTVRREGNALVIEPLPDEDEWAWMERVFADGQPFEFEREQPPPQERPELDELFK